MAMTLLEAAKLYNSEPMRQGIIEFYAGSSGLLQRLPIINIQGDNYSYRKLDTLPGVGFRGINENYTESTGIIQKEKEDLRIMGGDLDFDKFLVDTTTSEDQLLDMQAMHVQAKVQAMGLVWTSKFFKGDSESEHREFDGVQKRIVGNQKLAAGSTSGGDALSLYMLDDLISRVIDSNRVLFMAPEMSLRLSQSSRNTSVSGFITHNVDQFGRQISEYNGVPIVTLDQDNVGAKILPFSEANPGGGSAASTSIYCLSLGGDGVNGLQNDSIRIRQLGEDFTGPKLRTRVEWYSSFAIFNGRAAARLHGIKDAPVVV